MEAHTATKSRGILFKGPLVRAILENRKTQTRRIVKLTGPKCAPDCKGIEPERAFRDPGFGDGEYMHLPCKDDAAQRVRCPYGDIGDELWVRETWARGVCDTIFRADAELLAETPGGLQTWKTPRTLGPVMTTRTDWKSPIHLPRSRSRISLRITDVRVQRLQEISEQDAVAEGVPRIPDAELVCHCGTDLAGHGFGDGHSFAPMEEHRYEFSQGWNKINGAGSWESNPWVWAISFERVKP